jgi:hypothetical protein
MRTLVCTLAILGLAVSAYASDTPSLVANPSGIKAPVTGIAPPVQPIDPEDPLCGRLDPDGQNGLAAERWPSLGLEAWVLVNCEINEPTSLQGFNWYAIDDSQAIFQGVSDFAVWNASDVEGGCADDSNTVASGRDLPADQTATGESYFGRPAFLYHVTLPDAVTLEPGKYYFAARIVGEGGQSFILTVPCDGQKPGWFQSAFFGFPCAVPNSTVFGVDYCAAIQPLGKPAGPPIPKCIYQVRSVKIKNDICGNPSCTDCPYALGDIICTHDCSTGDDCARSLRGTSACPDGGLCKVTAELLGCDFCPRGSKRCR